MPNTARYRTRPTPQLFPTTLLQRGDQLTIRDAIDALPTERARRERIVDTIALLDSIHPLGADAIAGSHLTAEELQLAAEADRRTSAAWLAAALDDALERASRV